NEDIDYMIQVDIEEGLSKEIIEDLKLLHLKSLYNLTKAAYNNIIKLFTNKTLVYIRLKKILEEIIGLVPKFYDMCKNSYIYYTEIYETYQSCSLCNLWRYDSKNKSKKVIPYLSIKKRLEIQYNNKIRAEELLYQN
ncbi:12424_t:CDS:1, partial [Funneliformis caledonium]